MKVGDWLAVRSTTRRHQFRRAGLNFLVLHLLAVVALFREAAANITYENRVETGEAVFESVSGNCPGNFLLAAPYFCAACGNNGEMTTLEQCAKFCIEQGETCRGFTVSSADGKCYPKTIDSCASPQQNGINLFFSKKPKSTLHIYNFTIDEVNPGQAATARCLVSGFPPPTSAASFRFEYSNGTKIPGDITVTMLTHSAVEATLDITNVQESGQYILCSVASSDNGRASEWALTHVFALPVIPDAPQVAEADVPIFRMIRWRQFQEGDIGDGPVDNYYVYIRKENEDWGIYGKTEIPTVVACQPFAPCQKRIGPLQLNTRYAVSVAAIREGQGGVGKMSPVTIFKTPCENVTDITIPPVVTLDPSSPGHVVVSWDRTGEECEDDAANRVANYRIVMTCLSTGLTIDTNVSAPPSDAVCNPIFPYMPTSASNCSAVHFYQLSQHAMYDVSLVRVSSDDSVEVRTQPVRFKTPCGKPYARVINIRVVDWFRIANTNFTSMVMAWSPIAAKDTGCDSVDRYLIRIYDRHPATQGAFPIRNITVSGEETNVTITRLIVNVPYYVIIGYKNNEQIDSSPSDLIPFRLEPEAAQASKGPLPGIDMTMLIGLVVGAVVLTIVLTGLVIFIVMKGKQSQFGSDTDSPPSNRKSSVSSSDLPPGPNGVYINVNGNGNHHSNGHHHHQQHFEDTGDSELVLNGSSAHGKVKKSRRRSSQELNSNAMYSKAVRHSTSSSNGHVVETDEAVYNTRLDAAIGQQKF